MYVYYIVGRKKDMIRRSAENIAAREVETVLAAAPGVAEVAVVGVPDPLRGEEVKAYLKLKDGALLRALQDARMPEGWACAMAPR